MAIRSRETILAAIQSALTNLPEPLPEKPDMHSAIYQSPNETDPAVWFAQNFTARKGIFFYAQSLEEFRQQISSLVK